MGSSAHPRSSDARPARLQTAVALCAGAPIAAGALALAGWVLGNEALKGVAYGINVKTNAALALVLSGASLLLLAPAAPGSGRRTTGQVLAALVLSLGLATLSQHLVGWDLGIDQLLFHEPPGAAATISPNRMGPPASFAFTLIGAALLLLDRRTRRGRSPAEPLAVAVLLLTLISLIGYLFGVRELYGLARYTGIALQTAISLFLLGVGLLLARPDAGVAARVFADDAGGIVLRRMLPAAVLMPIALGWLRILGEDAGLYNSVYGRSLLVYAFIVASVAVSWWTASVVQRHAHARAEAQAGELRARDQLVAALQSARENERQLGLALSAGHMGPWVLDLGTGGLRCSPQAERLFGIAPGASLDRIDDFLARVHADDRERLREEFAAWPRRSEGDTHRLEYRIARDGADVWIESIGQIVRDERSGALRLHGVALDVTERKQAEQALREASRHKDTFLAILAHELRNPLAPIRNAVAFVKARGPRDAAVQQAHDVIDRQVEHMARLLDDLLDISRITRGRLVLRRLPVAVAEVVRAALETSRPAIDAAGHDLRVTLPGEELWLDADPLRIAQVLANLLNNAAKYTPRGGHIALGVARRGADVALTVTDDGIGIPADHLPRVFDIFAQAPTAVDRSEGGLGIGLSLVRGIVHAHGGRVEARSAGPGRGSQFTVSLPVAPPPVQTARAGADQAAPAPAPALRLVVADDNADALDTLAMVLEIQGHDVHTARDGAEAVAVAERVRPQVVLLDLGMPGLNGFEAARRIRSRPWGRSPVLVALTGWGQEQDRRAAAEAGFDHHLVKPVDLEALAAILTRAVVASPASQDMPE